MVGMHNRQAEQEWLVALRSEDSGALRSIFDAYYAMVRHTTGRLVTDTSLADDLAQEVFIRLWQKRAELQIEGSLGGYLRRMAINEALAHLRRKQLLVFEERPEQQALPAYERTDGALLQGELQQAINQAINALPSGCRAVFQLSRQESMTYQEIATQMNISVKTVENQMSKALKILRAKLAGYFSWLL
jgi:RNA polymerase sigma-70 factor (ECF subfamily)